MLLIDGYNVLFCEKGRRFFTGDTVEARRQNMLELLAEYRAIKRGRMMVVFDGNIEGLGFGKRRTFFDVEMVFSDPGSSADREIKEMLENSSNPREYVLITSDHELRDFASKLEVRVVSSNDFLETAVTVIESWRPEYEEESILKERGISSEEAEKWLRIFGMEDVQV